MSDFSVSRAVLSKMLTAVLPSSPGEACLKLEVSSGELRLTFTDLMKSVQAATPEVECSAEVEALVPAAKLSGIVSKSEPGALYFILQGRRLEVCSGLAAWDLRLPGTPVSDFAEIPTLGADTVALRRESVLAAFRSVQHAIAKDVTRPYLCLLSVAHGKVTASDGARFQQALLPGFPDMDIPAHAVGSLLKLLSTSEEDIIHITTAVGSLAFQVGKVCLRVIRSGSAFPNVSQLLLRPALENRHVLEFDKLDMSRAVSRALVTSDSGSRSDQRL